MRNFFLSTLEPGRRERRVADAVIMVSMLLFVLAAPMAKVLLVAAPAFLPAYQSALVVNELITAVLLLGQHRTLGAMSLLVLACGYLFSALMAVLHALSFPGLVVSHGLLGAGPQTTAWLYFFWHGGVPLFVIAYALLREAEDLPRALSYRSLWALPSGLAGVTVLALALAALATRGQAMLPAIMSGSMDAPGKQRVAAVTWVIGFVALAFVWRRRKRTVLDLWLSVALVVWILEVALAALLNHGRYDLGWYAGRVYGLLGSACVLVVLLLESNVLYGRLAASVEGERRKAQDLELLSQRMHSTNEQLATSNLQLAEASRLKSEFLANMSHELRTPLNAVIGFSDVLQEGLAGSLSDKQAQYVKEIHSSGGHLLSLINDILDVSKIEAGSVTLDLDIVSIRDLFGDILSIVKEQATKRGVALELDLPADLGAIAVDPRRIKQITYNLLSNAVKFSDKGGRVCLRVRRVGRPAVEAWSVPAETVVRRPLPASGATEFLQITVIDSGIGIAPQDAPRLFRVFSQIDSSITKQAEGTGLGLVLVDRLVALHGGTVAVASTPGQGSQFCVSVPWRQVANAADGTSAAQRAQSHQS